MKFSLIFLLSFCLALSVVAQEKPNFIIIYMDDLGYGDLSMNGHPTIQTPNIDGIANKGTVFTQYYSASPACTASRYALLTGKYPPRSGFRWVLDPKDPKGIHPDEMTLAEYLKENGYKNAIFGKWHLGSTKSEYSPLQNGFDEFLGLPYSNDMIPPKYLDIAYVHNNDTIALNPDQSQLTRQYTEAAMEFMKQNKKTPFFIYLPYAMPHTPLAVSQKFDNLSKRGKYGDAVSELDYYIGELTKELDRLGLTKKTYVIITSDNGPWLLQKAEGGSAGLFKDGKGSTWDGGMRVPFIVYGHKNIAKTSKNTEVISAIDLLPSIVKLAGNNSLKNEIDGQDLSHLFHGNGKGKDVFYYFGLNHKLFAVRKGKWKLHVETYSQLNKDYFNQKLPLLFNLEGDPSENYDVAEAYPEIVDELKQLLKSAEQDIILRKTFWDVK